VERDGVGLAADVSADDGDGAKLAHRAGVAEDDAVEQAPFDVGQGDPAENLPAGGAEGERGELLVVALRLHERDEFAGDEGEGDEGRGEHDAGCGKNDLEVVLDEPGPDPALGAEDQHVDQAGDHRGDGEGQIDQREQHAFPWKLELGDGPGCGDAEEEIGGHGDGGGQKGEPDGGERIGIAKGGEVGAESAAEGFGKDGGER